jgi:hypothetical protein
MSIRQTERQGTSGRMPLLSPFARARARDADIGIKRPNVPCRSIVKVSHKHWLLFSQPTLVPKLTWSPRPHWRLRAGGNVRVTRRRAQAKAVLHVVDETNEITP